jgi:serine/threonine protein kinase
VNLVIIQYNSEKGNHIYELKEKSRNKFNGFDDEFIKFYLKDTINVKYMSDKNLIHRDIKF